MTQENLYLARINRVMNFINTEPTGDLSLDRLAQLAFFSPFHFHRIFKDCAGQTLNQYVNRVRIERAVVLLRSRPEMRILDAALACGYESAEGFSRAFKKLYGISPRQWNRDTPLQERKIGQVAGDFPVYTGEELRQVGLEQGYKVEILPFPEQRLAYIRVLDSYRNWEKVVAAHDDLLAWYQAQGGKLSQAKLYGMSQDDPDVTPLEHCRFDWCLAIPEAWQLAGEIHELRFPACNVAAIAVTGDLVALDSVNQYLWRYWLPRSRYQPENLPAMEIYRRLPLEIGWETYDMFCAIPVIAL